MSELKVDKISPQSGTATTIGDSGDTFTVPSGATLTVAGALNVTGTTALADGTVAVAELDIDGATDIGAAIVDADLFVIDDGAGGTNRKTTASRLQTYILGANSVDSDAYVDGSIDQVHLATGVGGVSWQAVVTGATTMVSGRGYFVNTTSSAFTMTLPASPSIGDYVRIIDYAGTFDSNTCTIGRNSQKIAGASEDMTVTTERAGLELVYVDSTQGWLLTEV
jgi:hypothetical protein